MKSDEIKLKRDRIRGNKMKLNWNEIEQAEIKLKRDRIRWNKMKLNWNKIE